VFFPYLPFKNLIKAHNQLHPADKRLMSVVNPTSNTGVFPAITETVFVVPVVED
jgi:hypothetical protein